MLASEEMTAPGSAGQPTSSRRRPGRSPTHDGKAFTPGQPRQAIPHRRGSSARATRPWPGTGAPARLRHIPRTRAGVPVRPPLPDAPMTAPMTAAADLGRSRPAAAGTVPGYAVGWRVSAPARVRVAAAALAIALLGLAGCSGGRPSHSAAPREHLSSCAQLAALSPGLAPVVAGLGEGRINLVTNKPVRRQMLRFTGDAAKWAAASGAAAFTTLFRHLRHLWNCHPGSYPNSPTGSGAISRRPAPTARRPASNAACPAPQQRRLCHEPATLFQREIARPAVVTWTSARTTGQSKTTGNYPITPRGGVHLAARSGRVFSADVLTA